MTMAAFVVFWLLIGHFLLSMRVVELSRDRAVVSVYWGLKKKALHRRQWGFGARHTSEWFDATGKSMHGDALTELAIARGLL